MIGGRMAQLRYFSIDFEAAAGAFDAAASGLLAGAQQCGGSPEWDALRDVCSDYKAVSARAQVVADNPRMSWSFAGNPIRFQKGFREGAA